jgi:hypothetical protein
MGKASARWLVAFPFMRAFVVGFVAWILSIAYLAIITPLPYDYQPDPDPLDKRKRGVDTADAYVLIA